MNPVFVRFSVGVMICSTGLLVACQKSEESKSAAAPLCFQKDAELGAEVISTNQSTACLKVGETYDLVAKNSQGKRFVLGPESVQMVRVDGAKGVMGRFISRAKDAPDVPAGVSFWDGFEAGALDSEKPLRYFWARNFSLKPQNLVPQKIGKLKEISVSTVFSRLLTQDRAASVLDQLGGGLTTFTRAEDMRVSALRGSLRMGFADSLSKQVIYFGEENGLAVVSPRDVRAFHYVRVDQFVEDEVETAKAIAENFHSDLIRLKIQAEDIVVEPQPQTESHPESEKIIAPGAASDKIAIPNTLKPGKKAPKEEVMPVSTKKEEGKKAEKKNETSKSIPDVKKSEPVSAPGIAKPSVAVPAPKPAPIPVRAKLTESDVVLVAWDGGSDWEKDALSALKASRSYLKAVLQELVTKANEKGHQVAALKVSLNRGGSAPVITVVAQFDNGVPRRLSTLEDQEAIRDAKNLKATFSNSTVLRALLTAARSL